MSGAEVLKLDNQLCFPLYVASKEVIRLYHPHLSSLDLTYTQYIAMLVLWEEGSMSVKALGERLYLDTGTLTPLLKTMEKKGLITRCRSDKDERSVTVSLTDAGLALRDSAECVPGKVGSCFPLPANEAAELYRLLKKLIGGLKAK